MRNAHGFVSCCPRKCGCVVLNSFHVHLLHLHAQTHQLEGTKTQICDIKGTLHRYYPWALLIRCATQPVKIIVGYTLLCSSEGKVWWCHQCYFKWFQNLTCIAPCYECGVSTLDITALHFCFCFWSLAAAFWKCVQANPAKQTGIVSLLWLRMSNCCENNYYTVPSDSYLKLTLCESSWKV